VPARTLFAIACALPMSRVQTAAANPVQALEGNHAHDGSEDFFPGDFHIVPNIGEYGGLDEVAAISDAVAAAHERGALAPSRFDVAHDFIKLRLIYLWACSVFGSNLGGCWREGGLSPVMRVATSVGAPTRGSAASLIGNIR